MGASSLQGAESPVDQKTTAEGFYKNFSTGCLSKKWKVTTDIWSSSVFDDRSDSNLSYDGIIQDIYGKDSTTERTKAQ